MFLPPPRVKVSIVGSLRDREVACSASDRQGSNFESCVWRTVSCVISTTAFHARVRGSFRGPGGLKETKKMFLSHPLIKLSIVRSLRDRACSASDLQGLNFESCVWRAVSSHLSHHHQEVLLAQFSLYVHKSGVRSDSFFSIYLVSNLAKSE